MDTKIKKEVNTNDEAESRGSIKLEQTDSQHNVNYDRIGFEEVRMKVESDSSTYAMGVQGGKVMSETTPLIGEKGIKYETDVADYVTHDMLKRIKAEPNVEQWDELNQAMDVAEPVKIEKLGGVRVKEEAVDSTKTENMDPTELTDEVDIKPESQADGEYSAMTGKHWETGLGVGHRKAGEELFICYNCNYTAHSKKSLKVHIKNSNCNLIAHKRSHLSNRHACKKSDKTFVKKAYVGNQVIRKHPELIGKEYTCSECLYETTRMESAMTGKHWETGLGAGHRKASEELFICYNCNYTSHSKKSLKVHIRNSNCNLTAHKSSHPSNRHACKKSDKTFVKKACVGNHVIRKHPELIGKVYTCSECLYETTRKDRLESHIVLKHPTDKLGIKCPRCNAKFINNQTLSDHILRIHPNSLAFVTTRVYECIECTYKTIKKSNFDCHIVSKHPESALSCTRKIFKCTTCAYQTIRETHLNRHLLKH